MSRERDKFPNDSEQPTSDETPINDLPVKDASSDETVKGGGTARPAGGKVNPAGGKINPAGGGLGGAL